MFASGVAIWIPGTDFAGSQGGSNSEAGSGVRRDCRPLAAGSSSTSAGHGEFVGHARHACSTWAPGSHKRIELDGRRRGSAFAPDGRARQAASWALRGLLQRQRRGRPSRWPRRRRRRRRPQEGRRLAGPQHAQRRRRGPRHMQRLRRPRLGGEGRPAAAGPQPEQQLGRRGSCPSRASRGPWRGARGLRGRSARRGEGGEDLARPR
mmetsp:Transcript_48898/g.156375  ORF Transcript_48898/g.156375 Transcript_48898/m.156375 type:complete len:207 (-) Transcript_48898:1066-1686(-)